MTGHHILAVFSVLTLAACASEGQRMQQAGQNPSYAAAFDQGCDSGYNAAGNMFYTFKKDASRFAYDPGYAQGWNDGYQQCLNRLSNMNSNMQTEYMRENTEMNRKTYKNNPYNGIVKPGVDYNPALLNNLGK